MSAWTPGVCEALVRLRNRHPEEGFEALQRRYRIGTARASRLGRPRFDELTREDLETLASNERLVGIDVTGVEGAHELSGSRGHGYFVANQRVATDVLISLIYSINPARRGLEHAPGRSMWTFPDDYPKRIGDALYEAAPDLRRGK
jgi:hypothetical protein